MALIEEVHERAGPPAAQHAPWTMPPQPLPRHRSVGHRLGKGVAVVGLAAVVAVSIFRLIERRHPAGEPEREREHVKAARDLGAGAAILALSVLTDSSIEHYRGAYHNPAMYVAPAASAVSLANSLHMAWRPEVSGNGRLAVSALTLTTGIAGLAFHLYNVAKREGGVRLVNLFYGAPLLAPAAIASCGLAGLAAAQLVAEAEDGSDPTLLGLPAAPVIGGGAVAAMLGTVAEAALLHFRGAFHHPFMYVPVAVPPAAAATLAMALVQPRLRGAAVALLRLTAVVGIAGAGFHIYGVSRNLGGFYNWSQNLLNGPPIPAPPSFTGVALAGLAATRLLQRA
ncbi:MAG: hypothetical protein ACM3JG_13475 [Thiohalocapsa sp.]